MNILQNVNNIDNTFLNLIFNLEGRRFFSFFLPRVSLSADGYYYPLIPLIIFLINPEKALSFLITALIAFLIELPLYKLIKHLVKRIRPYEAQKEIINRVLPCDKFSLPSGHTSAAWVIAVILASHFPVFLIPVSIWAFFVGISRIYLGVHYPTDVLAGFFLGTISAVSSITIKGQLF